MFQTSHRWLWILMLAVGALFFFRPQSAQACNAEATQEGEAMENGDGSVTYEFIVSAAGRIINIDFAEGVVAEALTCGEGFVGEVGNEDGHYYASCIVDAPTTEWTVSIWPSDVSLTRVYVDVDASADSDQDGFTTCLDCNDSDAMVNSSATEICDGLDNDCDEQVDEDTGGGVFYPDTDGDGCGAGEGVQSCTAPEGYTSSSDDCDDADSTRYPGAIEICDGVDNDCDGTVDEGASSGKYYRDQDGDAYGDKTDSGKTGCVPEGSSANNLDCKDKDPTVYPGAEEICDDMDNDCDPSTNEDDMFDEDGDGFLSCNPTMDCDDGNADVHPYADEECNGIDDNCKDGIDEGCTESSPTPDDDSPTPSDPTPTLGGDDDTTSAETPAASPTPTHGDDDASAGGDDDDRATTPTPVVDDEQEKDAGGCGCTTSAPRLPASWSIFVAGLVWLWRSRRRTTR